MHAYSFVGYSMLFLIWNRCWPSLPISLVLEEQTLFVVWQDLKVRTLVGGRMLGIPVVEGQVRSQHGHTVRLSEALHLLQSSAHDCPTARLYTAWANALSSKVLRRNWLRFWRFGKEPLLPIKVPAGSTACRKACRNACQGNCCLNHIGPDSSVQLAHGSKFSVLRRWP